MIHYHYRMIHYISHKHRLRLCWLGTLRQWKKIGTWIKLYRIDRVIGPTFSYQMPTLWFADPTKSILRPTQRENGTWRIQKDPELEDIISQPNIIGEIQSAILRWLEHLERKPALKAIKRAYKLRTTTSWSTQIPREEVEKDPAPCTRGIHTWRSHMTST